MTEQELQAKELELTQREERIAAKEKLTHKAYEHAKQKYKDAQQLENQLIQRQEVLDAVTKEHANIMQLMSKNPWKLHPWYQGGHTLSDIVRRMRQDGLTQIVLYTPFQHTVYYVQLDDKDVWYTGWWHIKQTRFHRPTMTTQRNNFDRSEWRYTYFGITPEIATILHKEECAKPMQIHDRFVYLCDLIGGQYYLNT